MRTFSDLPILLFDLDGTLVDSLDLILESWRYTMDVHFGDVPEDRVWLESMGQPLRAQFRRWASSDEEVHALVETYKEHNHRVHHDLIRPFPGVRDTLTSLHARGHRLGIVTSKAAHGTTLSLEGCGLEQDWFEVIVTADEPVPHKPDPAPVLLALERIGGRPEHAAYVGDSVWDMRAGRGAGVTTVAALWGPFDRKLLAEEEPDRLIEAIQELLPA